MSISPQESRGRRTLEPVALLAAGVAFGLALAGGLHIASPSPSWNAPAEAATPVTPPPQGFGGLAALPSFADLSAATLPAVVSIDAVTIERGGRGRRGEDPLEFFFGPRRRPDGQGRPEQPEGEPEEFRSDSGGSGFVISADGLVVTNNHVIEGATRLRVHLGDRFYDAEVKGADAATDLALLKIDAGQNLRYLELGDSESLRVGDWVVAIGNPLLLEQTVTVGVVSAKNRSIGINDRSFENFIQTDAAINRGNSGGPLVDLAGRVVGIATAMNWGAENIGFAVPVDTLKEILPQLRDKGRVVRGYLGIEIGNLDHDTAEAFGLRSTDGALVASVQAETPAGRAGVRHGDIILTVDGRRIRETRDLISYVSNKGPGAKVELEILRDGKNQKLVVELGERPTGDDAAAEGEEREDGGVEWLGLQYQDLTAPLRRAHSIPDDMRGVWVVQVQPSSPLFEEGLREGDIITEVNGQPIDGAKAFEELAEAAKPGTLLRLYVRRIDPRGGRAAAFFAIVRVP